MNKILSYFGVSEVNLIQCIDAGPDEELYLFQDGNDNKYGLWSRDYMSELKYEATGLANDFNIDVKMWLRVKNSEAYTLEKDGNTYAAFVY